MLESLFKLKKNFTKHPATLIRKTSILLETKLQHRSFPMNFAKFLRTPFFTEHFWATASEIHPEFTNKS